MAFDPSAFKTKPPADPGGCEADAELEAALANRRNAEKPEPKASVVAKAKAALAALAPAAKAEPATLPPPKYQYFAADVAKQVAVAKAEVEKLATEHGQAALAALSGTGSEQDALALAGKLAEAQNRLRTLEAAHTAAVAKDKLTARAASASLAKGQLRSCQIHMAARQKAAEQLRASLEAAAAAWKDLIGRSAKAQFVGAQVGGTWPAGSLCDFGDLHRLVAAELFRVAGDPTIGNARNFPGAKPAEIRHLNQPSALEPIDEIISRASKRTLAALAGQVAE